MIPVLYHGTYTIPLTLVVALCIGLLLGRLRGLLYGMIGGLLIDISAGTLGTMTFFFMAVGFLVGLIVDESKDRRPEGFASISGAASWPSSCICWAKSPLASTATL